MNNSEELLKMLSSLVENRILTSQNVKKEILTNIKFQKDNLIEKLQVVSREEFEVLKKLVQKQEKQIEKLKRKKIIKKAKRS